MENFKYKIHYRLLNKQHQECGRGSVTTEKQPSSFAALIETEKKLLTENPLAVRMIYTKLERLTSTIIGDMNVDFFDNFSKFTPK